MSPVPNIILSPSITFFLFFLGNHSGVRLEKRRKVATSRARCGAGVAAAAALGPTHCRTERLRGNTPQAALRLREQARSSRHVVIPNS